MGERLAKDVEALFTASVEQRPAWRRMMQKGSISPQEASLLLVELFGALKEAVVYIAREVEDKPRRDDPSTDPPAVFNDLCPRATAEALEQC